MARPLKKAFFGTGTGSIQASAFRFTGQAESNVKGSVIAQKGTTKFRVTNGVTTQTLKLVNKPAGTLAEGEFIVLVTLDDGTTVVNALKFTNKRVLTTAGWKQFAVSDVKVAGNSKVEVDEDEEAV